MDFCEFAGIGRLGIREGLATFLAGSDVVNFLVNRKCAAAILQLLSFT